MLQNVRVTAFTISELLPPPPTQIRVKKYITFFDTQGAILVFRTTLDL